MADIAQTLRDEGLVADDDTIDVSMDSPALDRLIDLVLEDDDE